MAVLSWLFWSGVPGEVGDEAAQVRPIGGQGEGREFEGAFAQIAIEEAGDGQAIGHAGTPGAVRPGSAVEAELEVVRGPAVGAIRTRGRARRRPN